VHRSQARTFACFVGVVILCAGAGAQEQAEDRGIGVAVYVGDQIVWDYEPTPMLVTDVTPVARARFPVTDIHCHWTIREDPVKMLEAMDERNIRRSINLSGGWGRQFDDMTARFHELAPDRFLIFCNVDFSRIDEPDFAEAAVAEIRRCRAGGAAGLKIFKDLGLHMRDASGQLVPIDDERLDPIWDVCAELGMPVLIHSADPIAFFQPVDRHNERWMQLTRRPNWSFVGQDVPGHAEILAQRDRLMARHPKTTFIGAHMGGSAEDLQSLARTLDEHPNFVVDMSARVAELGRQPYSARRFFLKHQDRILFGTDRYPGGTNQPRDRIYFRFLETDDEYFDYFDNDFPPTGDWKIYGLFLPDEVLENVYSANADRILGTVSP
jgi:predicted TIM-barrel fold metal-dependent hydrolase